MFSLNDPVSMWLSSSFVYRWWSYRRVSTTIIRLSGRVNNMGVPCDQFLPGLRAKERYWLLRIFTPLKLSTFTSMISIAIIIRSIDKLVCWKSFTLSQFCIAKYLYQIILYIVCWKLCFKWCPYHYYLSINILDNLTEARRWRKTDCNILNTSVRE